MSKGWKIGVSALALMMAATAAQQVAASDWTGLYAGVHVGYGKGEASDSLACDYWDYNNPGQTLSGLVFGLYWYDNNFVDYCDYYGYGWTYAAFAVSEAYDYNNYTYDGLDDFSGFLIGGQAGYLYQNGSFVLGAEVSASGTSISDTSAVELGAFQGHYQDDYVETELSVDWLASAVVRAGFVPTDNVLLSANVGLAAAGTHFQYDGMDTGSWNDGAVATGWTVGAQVDVMVTDTISVFGAYSYTQLHDVAYSGSVDSSYYGHPLTFNYEYDLGIHAIKVGVNNRFN